MKLKMLDRIVLGSLLPREGKYEDLVLADDIKKKIVLSQDELQEYEVETVDSNIKWNAIGAAAEFDIEFSELEKGLLKKQLDKLQSDGKITSETLNLYKLFCL